MPGFHTEFFSGGVENDVHRATPPRGCGGGGMLPQEISCSEVAAQAGNY